MSLPSLTPSLAAFFHIVFIEWLSAAQNGDMDMSSDMTWHTLDMFTMRSHCKTSDLHRIYVHIWKWPKSELKISDSMWIVLFTLRIWATFACSVNEVFPSLSLFSAFSLSLLLFLSLSPSLSPYTLCVACVVMKCSVWRIPTRSLSSCGRGDRESR